MECRTRVTTLLCAGLLVGGGAGTAQQMPSPQEMQLRAEQIMQQRPREAEAAARAFLHIVQVQQVALDSLKVTALEQYWSEVAQLTVQFDVVQSLARRDSVRSALVSRMFALEAQARERQRAYRAAEEAARAAIRSQLTTLIGEHFDIESQLRTLEVADIRRRLAAVEAESERRRTQRDEMVRWAVDDIIRDAMRPR